MLKEQYNHELRRLKRVRRLKGNERLPKDVYNYGFELAKRNGQAWLHERVVFWIYAYDKTHKWTIKDWQYEINDAAWKKAKEKRKERREKRWKALVEKHNKPRPLPEIETSWEDCSGPPLDLIKEKFS